MTRTIATAVGVLLTLALARPADLRAQAAAPTPSPVATLFADASAKETAVKKALTSAAPPVSVLKAVRTVVSDFEAVVRQFPSSGYCDDALWEAAQLSSDAFAIFGDPREQTTAVRLLKMLTTEYPKSKFARQAPAALEALKVAAARTPRRDVSPAPAGPPPAAAAVAPTPVPSAAAAPATDRGATIKEIRRGVLLDVIRVVIELDTEVTFHDERLEGPSRIFVDLANTKAGPALLDQTIRFDGDGDLVRQIRIGRQPTGATRVVLDATGISSYSVYPLYSPYRLVIDCLRPAKAPATSAVVPRPPPPQPIRPTVPLPMVAKPAAHATPLPLAARGLVLPLATAPDMPPRGQAAFIETVTTAPAVAAAVAAPLPSKPAPPVAAAIPAPAEPSRNLGGGLSMARQLGLGVSHIVIDPGHGGYDPGTTSGGVSEAELVLDIALRLEKLLTKLPGVTVTLTRRTDTFVPLQERTAIANRENADLFLSIHTNANSNKLVQGVETYFLNFATNLSAAAVAARENAASGQLMGELPDMLKTIALNSKLDESHDFATYVQREMVSTLQPANKTLKDLGVKQAPFVVLIGAAMPSVLAEVSFMTNAQDARLVKNPAYRQKIAESLFEGLRKYQAALKSTSEVATQ